MGHGKEIAYEKEKKSYGNYDRSWNLTYSGSRLSINSLRNAFIFRLFPQNVVKCTL